MDIHAIYEGQQYKELEKLFAQNLDLIGSITDIENQSSRRIIERFVTISHPAGDGRSVFISGKEYHNLSKIGLFEQVERIITRGNKE